MQTFYLVMSTGIVHGVYGEALLDMAQTKAKTLPGAVIFRARLSQRPSVGKTITPQVGWETIPCA